MSVFRVGMKVVCVKQRRTDIGFKYPPKGAVMTVRAVSICPFTWKTGLRLEGWQLPIHPDGKEYLLEASCFKPVVERKTSIEIFQAMLTWPRLGVRA